jgi:UDP-N-acetylmuramyl tripeptide synthase
MLHQGVSTVAMEVSSHALTLNRVKDCEFDAAIFTNLTQDHLDFHKTMDEYFLAKKKLFDSLSSEQNVKQKKYAILNKDDMYSHKIIVDKNVKKIFFSVKEHADVYAKDISYDVDHCMSIFTLVFEDKKQIEVKAHLLGEYNISNICACAALAYAQGLSIEIIKKGIESLDKVPGRCDVH